MVYFCPASIRSFPDNCPPLSLNGSIPLPTVRFGTSGSFGSTYNPGIEYMIKDKLVNVLIPLTRMMGLGKDWDLNLELIAPGVTGSLQEIEAAPRNQK